MTNSAGQTTDWLNQVRGLPDPVTDRQFYDGVPARRLFAFFVDVVLVWAVVIVIGILTLGIGFLLAGLVLFVVDLSYRVLTLSDRSATPGMRLMGIELRDGDGDRFTTAQALGHTLLFYLSLTFFVVHLVSIILMAGSALGRGLHDMPFGSTMMNSPE